MIQQTFSELPPPAMSTIGVNLLGSLLAVILGVLLFSAIVALAMLCNSNGCQVIIYQLFHSAAIATVS